MGGELLVNENNFNAFRVVKK